MMRGKAGRTHKKIAIILLSGILNAARWEAKARQPRSLSAFIAQAVEEKLERSGRRKYWMTFSLRSPFDDLPPDTSPATRRRIAEYLEPSVANIW